MSSYRGRTGPNVSEYLNSLNTLSSPYDQDQSQGEDFNLDDNLALFTNTDFTHFDMPALSDNGLVNFDLDADGKAALPVHTSSMKYEDLLAGMILSQIVLHCPINTHPQQSLPPSLRLITLRYNPLHQQVSSQMQQTRYLLLLHLLYLHRQLHLSH